MQRSTSILALAVLSFTLASCIGPDEEARPFAGRGPHSLDHPPRYGDSRYMDSKRPSEREYPNDPNIDPRTIPPGANTTPPAGLGGQIDPGVTAAPPGANPPAPASPTPPPATAPSPAPTTDVPYARPVPGKPGFVYNPHDGKILDVTGMRPGTKVKDPQTGAMFRVP